MRDLLLLVALCATIPLILRAPIVGVLVWMWLSLMCPHQEVAGFLHGAQLNVWFTVLTAIAWAGSKEPKTPPANAFIAFLVLFAAWTCVSTYFALDRSDALPSLDRNLKTVILALAVAMLANSRARLQAVIWVIVISIGYYGAKGGGFTLLTGSQSHVFGPAASMIQDNNALGLALVVLLPLMVYLRLTSKYAIVRWALLGLMFLTLAAILGTYSRGALIALGASAAIFALRSRYGLVLLAAGAIGAAALPSVMPHQWLERMHTIKAADQDASFEDRVAAWRSSFNIAMDRPLVGGGFSAVESTEIVQAHKTPGSLDHGRAAHSVYFQVLGDNGFVGLALYLTMVGAAVLNTFRVLALVRGRSDLKWAGQLARMLQVSLVAFLAGGAALSMAYYDGFMVMFAVTAALLQTVRRPVEAADEPASFGPRWRRVAAVSAPARAAH
ncbi:MAG TPA: putative O-glycosylation ligase, exosortase A system-associated [Caulobacteraceae bacterium]|jgi:probable O-glycosylation ligase (exosortase A-associated)